MMMSTSRSKMAGAARRFFATMKKMPAITPAEKSIIPNLPAFADDGSGGPIVVNEKKMNQFMASRKPVTSAHAVDVKAGKISNEDSVAISSSGSIVHGTYGELGAVADAIPLEYLALLRFAAQGAAGVRAVTSGSSGTLMVYGATEASGMAATQIASAAGYAVVGVVGGEHSGNTAMVESIKGLINYPGTAVPDVYAMSKKNFLDLVEGIAAGDEGFASPTKEDLLEEFKANLLEYCVHFPENLPAAVDAEQLKFKGMDKDREFFQENMEAYLSQFQPGAPPIDKTQLDTLFTPDQYDEFRKKFWDQTSAVVSGEERMFFSPPHIVKEMLDVPAKPMPSSGFPYSFSVTGTGAYGVSAPAGGSISGAVIVVTPALESAAKAIDAAKTIRQKGEALSFLTSAERTAFSAASSVAAVAKKHHTPVVTIGGSLPGLDSVEPSKEDVDEALAAMDIGEDGSTKLNYFVQTYRACDFPFYGDYAVHKASEPLAGPRQIVVTK